MRIGAWLDRHSRVADAMVGVPLLVVSLITAFAISANEPQGPPLWGYLVASLAQVLPLFVRRRFPVAVFGVVAAAAAVQVPFHLLTVANVAVLVAMYNVAVRRSLPWAAAAGVTALVGDAMLAFWYDVEPTITGFVNYALTSVAIWIAGRYTRSRRAQLAGLRERARRLERERDAHAQAAAAAERARIARDLHDVVAHSVSVMVVQADGGAFALDREPDEARRAFATISKTGREALAEMRRMLGVLRDDESGRQSAHAQPAYGPWEEHRAPGAPGRLGPPGQHEKSGYAPQPGLAELDDLVAHVRAAGLPVELTVDGTPRELPKSLELVVYRVIQESLTNTLKHGGPGATAKARLHYGDGSVEAAVCDDGRGAGSMSDGLGHGLIGLRERVGMYGGTVTAGPRPGGGYEVVARMPVEPR